MDLEVPESKAASMLPPHRKFSPLCPNATTGPFSARQENELCSGTGSRSKKKAVIPLQGAFLINTSGCKCLPGDWLALKFPFLPCNHISGGYASPELHLLGMEMSNDGHGVTKPW